MGTRAKGGAGRSRVLLVTDPSGAHPRVATLADHWHQPTGLVVDSGRIYVSDRDGFYQSLDTVPPAVWLPAGTAYRPSQPVPVLRGTYAGDWLLGDDFTHGIWRVSLQDMGGAVNGAVFGFSGGTDSAPVHRMAWSPDGSLYLGTIPTRISWEGAPYPLYRLVPKPTEKVFDFKAVRSTPAGLELEFTQPVDPATIDSATFTVWQWRYERTREYGGRELGKTQLPVGGFLPATVPQRITLPVPGMREGHVLHVKVTGAARLRSSAGDSLWARDAWFTLNKLAEPCDAPGCATALAARRASGLRVRHRILGGRLEVRAGRDVLNRLIAAGACAQHSHTHTRTATTGETP